MRISLLTLLIGVQLLLASPSSALELRGFRYFFAEGSHFYNNKPETILAALRNTEVHPAGKEPLIVRMINDPNLPKELLEPLFYPDVHQLPGLNEMIFQMHVRHQPHLLSRMSQFPESLASGIKLLGKEHTRFKNLGRLSLAEIVIQWLKSKTDEQLKNLEELKNLRFSDQFSFRDEFGMIFSTPLRDEGRTIFNLILAYIEIAQLLKRAEAFDTIQSWIEEFDFLMKKHSGNATHSNYLKLAKKLTILKEGLPGPKTAAPTMEEEKTENLSVHDQSLQKAIHANDTFSLLMAMSQIPNNEKLSPSTVTAMNVLLNDPMVEMSDYLREEIQGLVQQRCDILFGH